MSALCAILGVMIAFASVTGKTRDSRRAFINGNQEDRILNGPVDLQERYASLSQEVSKLQKEKTKLEDAVANQTSATKVLNENLQDANVFAGLTELEGPGVVITLRDSAKQGAAQDLIIHDTDVLKVSNELFAAGADAIAVNGHRLAAGSSIRCVGPVIHIDGEPIASPVAISAIGDPSTLSGGLNLPNGVLAEIRFTDPNMVQVEAAKSIKIPAYTGPTTKRKATQPKPKR